VIHDDSRGPFGVKEVRIDWGGNRRGERRKSQQIWS